MGIVEMTESDWEHLRRGQSRRIEPGLFGSSWWVLRRRPGLLILPGASGVGWLLCVVVAAEEWSGLLRQQGVALGLLGAAVVVTWLISSVLNAALLVAVDGVLCGEPVSLGQGLASVSRRLPLVVGWAVVRTLMSVVNAVVRAIPVLGPLADEALGFSWAMAGGLVLPVMLVERVGVVAALRRSVWLSRVLRGASIAGGLRIGVLGIVLLIPSLAALILAAEADQPGRGRAILLAAVAWICFVSLVTTTLSGIFRMAMYHRALELA